MQEFNTKRLLQYQEYADCFTVKVCDKNGKIIRQNFLGGLKIKSSEPLRIGFDQSSSQTGVAVKKSSGGFLCLIDLVNSSHLPYGIYRSMLGLKIEQLFNSCEVEMCVVEKMWGGNRKSYELLTNLGEFISGFKYILEGWRNAEISEILPNVWRSAFLCDPKYKGMFTKDKVKVAVELEGIERYPQLHDYGMYYKEGKHVNDSFDALGIIEGYEKKTFSEDGNIRKVANTMSPTNHKYTYKVYSCDGVDDLLESLSKESPKRSVVEYEYNPEFPFYENVRRVTSVTNKIVYMKVVHDVVKIQFMWLYGVIINRDDTIYLVCWRDNVSPKLGNF